MVTKRSTPVPCSACKTVDFKSLKSTFSPFSFFQYIFFFNLDPCLFWCPYCVNAPPHLVFFLRSSSEVLPQTKLKIGLEAALKDNTTPDIILSTSCSSPTQIERQLHFQLHSIKTHVCQVSRQPYHFGML